MTVDPWHRRLLGALISAAVGVVSATVRRRREGWDPVQRLRESGERLVYAFWHGRQFIMLDEHAGDRGVIMVSLSADGTLQREVLERRGYATVRGSGSRRGGRALVEMKRLIETEGYQGGLAVDGPQGPREVAKDGAVALAAKVGGYIVPMSAAVRRRWMLRSWDRLQIPWPFTSGWVVYGPPIRVEDTDSSRRHGLDRLQHAMDEATRRAEELVGRAP